MGGRFGRLIVCLVLLLYFPGCVPLVEESEEAATDYALYKSTELQIVDLELIFGAVPITEFAFIGTSHVLLVASTDTDRYASVYSMVYGTATPPVSVSGLITRQESQTICNLAQIEYTDMASLSGYRDRRTSPDGNAYLTIAGNGLHVAWRDVKSPRRHVVFESSLLQLTVTDIAFISDDLLVCTYRRSIPMLRDNTIPVHLIELVGWSRFSYWTYSRPIRDLHIGSLIDDFNLDFDVVEGLYKQAYGARAEGYALIHLQPTGEELSYSLHQYDEYSRILPLKDGAVLILPDSSVAQRGAGDPSGRPLLYMDTSGVPREIDIAMSLYSGVVSQCGEFLVCFEPGEEDELLTSLKVATLDLASGNLVSKQELELPFNTKYPSTHYNRVRGDIWDTGARMSANGEMLALRVLVDGRECLVLAMIE